MGGKYLVNGLECRLQDSQVISNQACRFRNFFLGPIPELVSASFSSPFQDIPQVSTQLTQHYLLHLQETQQIMSTKTLTWHSWKCEEKLGPEKKVPESAGLVGVFGPLVEGSGPSLAQT